jgi:hypothetical protein
MSQFPCCRHGAKVGGKLTNAYVSWYFPADKRQCFYTRWCTDCFIGEIYPIIKQLKEMGAESESHCIVDLQPTDTPQQTFMSLFPPKREQVDYTFVTCQDCFADFRNNLASGGKYVTDRGAGVGAQDGAPTITEDRWAEVEL